MARFPQARFLLSAAQPTQYPADLGAEVAFAGRSNAGKSSAINAIVGRQGLARASKTPGRTRLINFFELSAGARLIDLPGYGYASAPESERRTWPLLMDALRQRSALRGLFVIIDARRGPMDGDAALLDWAAQGAARVHVLLTKADKLNRQEARQALAAARVALPEGVGVQLFSAQARTGIEEAQRMLSLWLESGGGE